MPRCTVMRYSRSIVECKADRYIANPSYAIDIVEA